MARSHFVSSHLSGHLDLRALRAKFFSSQAINKRVVLAIICTLPCAVVATFLAAKFSSNALSLSMMLSINCFVYAALFMDRPSAFSAAIGTVATIAVLTTLQTQSLFLPQVAALIHASVFFVYALRFLYLRPFCLVMSGFWFGFSLPLI